MTPAPRLAKGCRVAGGSIPHRDPADVREWIATQRAHRRDAKAHVGRHEGWAAVADAALAAELAAERLALDQLYGRLAELSWNESTSAVDAARRALTHYAQIAGIDPALPPLSVLASALATDTA